MKREKKRGGNPFSYIYTHTHTRTHLTLDYQLSHAQDTVLPKLKLLHLKPLMFDACLMFSVLFLVKLSNCIRLLQRNVEIEFFVLRFDG